MATGLVRMGLAATGQPPDGVLAQESCQVIRSIRRLQGRDAAFERYYQELFVTYRRYPALKDGLRKTIEGTRGRRQV